MSVLILADSQLTTVTSVRVSYFSRDAHRPPFGVLSFRKLMTISDSLTKCHCNLEDRKPQVTWRENGTIELTKRHRHDSSFDVMKTASQIL